MKMINFKSFIIEDDQMQQPMQQQAPSPDQQQPQDQQQPVQRTHLTHVEDHVLHSGNEGVALADNHLRGLHDKLLGKDNDLHVSTKWDGAPSVVYGIDPTDGKFFVGTKGVFNKTPKMAKSHEDIAQMFGHAPGLQAKMHAAFEHLPKIMPRTGGVFQGDIIGTADDAQIKNGMVSQTPNTLTYSAKEGSAEGEGLKAPFSFVTHTQYVGDGPVQEMNATGVDDKTRSKFKTHADVNHIDPSVNINPANYTPEEQKAFLDHMEAARKTYLRMKPEELEAVQPHSQHLESHVNDMIRNGGSPSYEGYLDFLNRRHQKDVDSVKTEAAKDKKRQAFADVMQHITENKKAFENALKLHGHLQDAKNVLVGVMEKNNPYTHSVGGTATGPEGTVIVDKDNNASKLNNRQEFNRLNFLKGQFQRGK